MIQLMNHTNLLLPLGPKITKEKNFKFVHSPQHPYAFLYLNLQKQNKLGHKLSTEVKLKSREFKVETFPFY